MQFEFFVDFLNMGGYVFYVWFLFGVMFLVMGIIVIQSFSKYCDFLKQVVVEKECKVCIKKV